MAKKSTTFGVNPDKLAELLGVGSDTNGSMPAASADDEKAELLLDRLAEPLLMDPSFMKLLPNMSPLLTNAMELCGGESVGDILLDKDVELGLLRKVKDLNNKLSQHSDSKNEKDIAVAIYYAAIASALVFHNEKITAFEYDELDKAFRQLKDKAWMPRDLQELFDQACTICRDPSDIKDNTVES